MGTRRDDGVDEIIGISIASLCEVEPCVRVLMNKERIVSADVGVWSEINLRPREIVPMIRRYRMLWRADGEKVHHHQLAIVVPTGINEARIGAPAFGKCLAGVEHPRPLDALVEL